MTFTIDADKTLSEIYKVSKNEKLEKLVYTDSDDNKVEIKVKEIGEFLITYKDDSKDKK